MKREGPGKGDRLNKQQKDENHVCVCVRVLKSRQKRKERERDAMDGGKNITPDFKTNYFNTLFKINNAK